MDSKVIIIGLIRRQYVNYILRIYIVKNIKNVSLVVADEEIVVWWPEVAWAWEVVGGAEWARHGYCSTSIPKRAAMRMNISRLSTYCRA